ncbi:hypothetical protein COV17_01090 [Candidatus Woesearchaeota archaeon CG10_big_fil_rev_8_21_14_0_10_36_11]|nr:MAG: hypothetical protein COV17_01090 [Candidatus Woesearchaeota archaeon CG10_big_fil_rev_8_21_14_0_10_36_11]
MKKECEHKSQKEVIKSSNYLYKLYNQKAIDFVKEKGIFDVVDRFLGETSYGLLFCKLNELYALEFLRWMQYLIIPVYEFSFLKDKIIKGFKNNIILDSVVSLEKNKSGYSIKTNHGKEYYTKNVVIATPPHISQKLLKLKSIKKPAKAYMFHIQGKINNTFSNVNFQFFHESGKLFDIALQSDGTYLFYCGYPNPKLSQYFTEYKIIEKHNWNPAFNIKGKVLLDCKQSNNLYLIGDHNICGMEDAFITGLYAANQILIKYFSNTNIYKSKLISKVKKKRCVREI